MSDRYYCVIKIHNPFWFGGFSQDGRVDGPVSFRTNRIILTPVLYSYVRAKGIL
jgi:hypothetical protein